MVFCINSVIQIVYFLYLSEVLQTNILHFPVQDYWGIKCNVYTEWVIFLKNILSLSLTYFQCPHICHLLYYLTRKEDGKI